MRPASSVARCAVVLIGLGAVAVTGGPAHAQMESREAISLQNQILELRHELDQMQGNPGGGGPVAPPIGSERSAPPGGDVSPLAPQLLDRVQTLEQQVRDMRGELDQLTNQVQQQNATLTKQIGDMNFAIQQAHGGAPGAAPDAAPGPDGAPSGGPDGGMGGGGGDMTGAGAMAAPARPAPPPPPAHRTPEAALAAGNAALARRDYAAAQAAAQDVLSGPRSPRQVDAQYLLGQSLGGQHQYQQAAVAYYDAYNRAPRSGRAPDALLGVSASLLALGDKNSACQALAKLHAEFPQPAPRVHAAYAALHARGGCH